MTVPTREAELDELMSRLARGDRCAFEPLYEALRPRAARLVAMRVPRSQAPDVVQSTMMKVFARASEFTPGRPCLPWFYGVVANEIRTMNRREARFVAMDVPDDALVDDAQPEALLIEQELQRALDTAVDMLDEAGAKAIHALLGCGPLPEVTPATYRKRVSRAYAKLRLLLGGHDAS